MTPDHLRVLQPHLSLGHLLQVGHHVSPSAPGHPPPQEPTEEASGEQHPQGGEVQLRQGSGDEPIERFSVADAAPN